jgi:hypothetical protein
MNKACSVCGNTSFKIIDNVLMCHNNHIMHTWNGAYLVPIFVY